MFRSYELKQTTFDQAVEVAIPANHDLANLTALRLNNLVAQLLTPGLLSLATVNLESGAKAKGGSTPVGLFGVVSVQMVARRKGVDVGVITSATWIFNGGVIDEFKVGFELTPNPTIVADEIVLRLTTENLAYAVSVLAFVDSDSVKVKQSDYDAAGYRQVATASPTGETSVLLGVQLATAEQGVL